MANNGSQNSGGSSWAAIAVIGVVAILGIDYFMTQQAPSTTTTATISPSNIPTSSTVTVPRSVELQSASSTSNYESVPYAATTSPSSSTVTATSSTTVITFPTSATQTTTHASTTTTSSGIPSSPGPLSLHDVMVGNLLLDWTPVPHAEYYNVLNLGTGQPVWTHISASSHALSITHLQGNTTYHFGVVACNQYGCSEPATITVNPIQYMKEIGQEELPGPSAVNVHHITNDAFELTWSPVSGATGYRITMMETDQVIANVSSNTTSYIVSGLQSGVTYHPGVSTCNSVGCGAATMTGVTTVGNESTTSSASVSHIPSMQLTVHGSQFRTNESVPITLDLGSTLSGSGLTATIEHVQTGTTVTSATTGQTVTAQVTSTTPTTETFQGLLLRNGTPIAHSNTVAITWASQANDTNAGYTNAQGHTVGLSLQSATHSGQSGEFITMTPHPSGFTDPVFQYWWLAPGGAWQSNGGYTSQSSYTVPADINGAWQFTVYARDASAPSNETSAQRAQYEAKANTASVTVSNGSQNVPTYAHTATGQVGLQGIAGSYSVGASVTLQAVSSGITNPVYQFWVQDPSGTWSGNGPYTSTDSYTVHLNNPGDYHFSVYARPGNAPSNETAKERAEYEVYSTTYSTHVS